MSADIVTVTRGSSPLILSMPHPGTGVPPEVAAQLDTQLLRSIEYSVRWLAWSKTRDGHNGRRPPEHVRFPWEEPQRKPGFQGDAMGLDEAVEWLGWSEHLAVENARREAAGLPTIKGEVTRG